MVGFDWPSNGRTLEYVFNRLDARAAANELMEKVFAHLPKGRSPTAT
ncbi:hypothetical protein [uncultured Roseobacter sp.]